MSARKQISILSTAKEINKSKKGNLLDLSLLNLFNIYNKYYEFSKNVSDYYSQNLILKEKIDTIKYKYPDIICPVRTILPININTTTGVITGPDNQVGDLNAPGGGNTTVTSTPTGTNFSTTVVSNQTLFGSGSTFPTHNFTSTEFLANYTDNNDNSFNSIIIDRTNFNEGNLKFNYSPTEGFVVGELTDTSLIIPLADIGKWSFYTSSTSVYSHAISFKYRDVVNGINYDSNTTTITIDRTSSENQPATVGDGAIKVLNRATTIITLTMLTSDLTPPYNDPEGDLIDAIRIDEISTANTGVLNYNGSPVTTGQIITREDINAGLFTHVGPDVNTIETDAFNFSVRDEGSQQWVS